MKSILLLLSSAMGIFGQTCTLTPSVSTINLSYLGTSTGGVTPEIPQTFTVTAVGVCGQLSIAAVSSTPSCAPGNLNPTPWLASSLTTRINNADGLIQTVSFTALVNTAGARRSGTISVTAAAGASTSVTVTEDPSTETLDVRQIRALYASILGRDADPGGFYYWTGVGLDGLGYMADSFVTSPEAFNNAFAVIAAYLAATGAPPSYVQFLAAVAAIRGGAQTVAGLFNMLIAGNAGYNSTTLYGNLLGRAPTSLEAQLYLFNGPAAVFESIIGYPATTAPVGALTNNEFMNTGSFVAPPDHTNPLFIRMFYFTILNRDPDQGGLAFWVAIANAGGPGVFFNTRLVGTQIEILGTGTPGQGFVGSPEFTSSFCSNIP